MKMKYYKDTDSLYIDLKEDQTSDNTIQVANGINIDLNENGELIGIDIDTNASQKVNIKNFNFERVEEPKLKVING